MYKVICIVALIHRQTGMLPLTALWTDNKEARSGVIVLVLLHEGRLLLLVTRGLFQLGDEQKIFAEGKKFL